MSIMKKEYCINLFRFAIVLACVVLMWIVWELYIDDFPVREECIVETDHYENVSIPFSQIRGLAISLENISEGYTEEKYLLPVKIAIEEENGKKIWEADCGEIEVKTFAFTNIDNLPEMPLAIDKNEKYTIRCYLNGEETDSVAYVLFGEQKTVGFIYVGCCIVALLLLCFILWCNRLKLSFEWKFVVIYILLGILYNIAYIPFSVPDEMVHFGQAYAHSNHMLGKEMYNQNGYVLFSDSGMLRLERCQDGARQGLYRFWNNWGYGNKHIAAISTKFVYQSNLKQYVYYPIAAIVSMMRIIKAPYQIVFLSGRIANLLFFVLIMVLAMKLSPKFQKTITAICFLPTTIWLASSYSYDSWNMSLCILFFAYCMYCKDREEKVKWRDLIVLCTICAVLSPIKVVYALIGACIILIPRDRFKNVFHQIMSYILIILSGFTAAMKGRGSTVIDYVTTQEQDVRSVVENRQGYTISWVLENPLQTIKVYINTLIERGERYVYTAIGGDFLEYQISQLLIYIILFIFLLIIMNELNDNKPTIRERIISGGIFLAGAAAVLTAFLFSYSVIHKESIGTINGVQGRYFLPFFVLLPIALQCKLIRIDGKEAIFLRCMIILNVVTVWCNFVSIMH